MKRMRTLEESMLLLINRFKQIDSNINTMDSSKKAKFIGELNDVQHEWLKQAVEEGYMNYQQAFQMVVYADQEVQLSVMDQLTEYQLKGVFQIAYELVVSGYLELKESRDLFEVCLDGYRGVYF